MELLIFGGGGVPVVVFPTSGGRFFDFEDRGMVAALAERIESGSLQLFCLDSVDSESWYNHQAPGRSRIARHLQYEEYVLDEVLPLLRRNSGDLRPLAMGCSFGGYHAANIALRHPDLFSGFVSLSGVYDLAGFLDGYYDEDCFWNLPTHYLPRLEDRKWLTQLRQARCILVSGWDDPCLEENRKLDHVLSQQGIEHQFHVWNGPHVHDWPTWQQMVREYL